MARKVTRRYFLRLALGSTATLGLSALGGAGYAMLIEPHWVTVRHVDVPTRDLPAALDGFTIMQLSDLHRGPVIGQEDVSRVVDLALQQSADLVVLTGDFVSSSAGYAASCAEALAPLATAGNALACLGNHDHWTDADAVAGSLTDVGVTVLRNESQEVADGLWIAAVDDVWERRADLDEALRKVPPGAATVLLAHEPDYADLVATDGRVSVQISGHSHGGQVQIPLVGPLILPYLAQKYHTGAYEIGGMWLYVNRGIGIIRPAVRFNCRPEITLLTLRA
jgi:predicted MPP superfamily phosphohydrolase